MKISGYAALHAKAPLQPFSYEAGPLLPNEVEVKVTHCGICHSDVHLVDDDWKESIYPLVPGHEIVGTIAALGNEVRDLKIGQRVGIGWQCNSCLTCEWCTKGEENFCDKFQGVALGHHGGFAEKVRSHSRFVIPIPDALTSEAAAPLLCAGITVYSPLSYYNVRPNMRVGVVGVGGLGHLALQFARAFGCEVVALDIFPDKESEAKKFGATQFIDINDKEILNQQIASFDFILAAIPVSLNWDFYLSLLRPHGKLCLLGSGNNFELCVYSLRKKKSICGDTIGSPETIKEMLAFAARHKIGAVTQTLPLEKANAALDIVRNNKARYRVVLTVP